MYDPPTLTLENVDYGGSIGTTDVVFELPPSDPFVIEEGVRTGYLVDGTGSSAIALLDEFRNTNEGGRKGVHVDLGGGTHTWTVECNTPVTQRRPDTSELYQWGATRDDSVRNAASATGADAEVQLSVLIHAFTMASPDSLTPATWTVGEYHPDGVLDPADVVLEQPNVVVEGEKPNAADINMTLIETADLEQAYDKSLKLG